MKKIVLILGLLIGITTNAQEFKIGKVSAAELQEKQHPIETDAPAAILYKTGDVRMEYNQNDGFVMVTTVKNRIKIYNKDGYDWANKSVPYYYSGSSKESVSIDEAVTYNWVDGKIEKTKLKSDGIFDETINKYSKRKKITMPNVKEGSVIEYEYTIRSDRFGELPDWYFQYDIPVNFSEFKTKIPEYYVYKPSERGYIFPKVTTNKVNRTINMSAMQRTNGGFQSAYSQNSFDYLEEQNTYTLTAIPSMKDESYVNNINNYRASIVHELSMTKFPGKPLKSYSTDWNSVVKTIYDFDSFGLELNKTGYFEKDIDLLIKGLGTNEEKMLAIHQFVKSKMKWNDYYGYGTDEGVRKAYADGVGNVAAINLMLTAMLRYAGLAANPVILSTRDNGIALFPSHAAFNYVIAAVETAEGVVLLDATDKYSTPNVLPNRDLNWFGRLIRKDGTSEQIDLMPKQVSRETVNMTANLDPSGTFNGKIRKQYTNQLALSFRKSNNNSKDDGYLEELEKKSNNIEINDYTKDNMTDLSKAVSETFSFKDGNDSELINGKIYFTPMLFLVTKSNPFKLDVREYPIDFSYPIETRYNINIELPEGYVVESMPENMNIAAVDNLGFMKYIIVQNDNKIQIAITETINEAIVPAEYYDVLKAFFQQMIDKENQKIVLKKI
ncbi:DUF3857 domain-containing protein [Flavobacterium branchiophilum]|uniref:Transglutaminase n=1 Tax=Flavobacterium branchiophilum TaxID=55197 RepID=A0A2H3KXN1_9FLAO|nr:DUF3857 domain-containing protein [Flavobacterium branchiophilum]PDS25839.1 transglutaminase [Flavobacterium branchiophilum]